MKIKCQINAKSATFILWSPSYVIVSQLKFYNQHMFTGSDEWNFGSFWIFISGQNFKEKLDVFTRINF